MGIEDNGMVLMDGGHDTELRKYVGNEFDGHPLWICRYLVEKPDLLKKIYREFIQAGAEAIMTTTYQSTIDGYKKYFNLSTKESLELMEKSVKLVEEAVKEEQEKGLTRHIAIVGCVGPYGAYLNDGSEYAGGFYVDDMTIEELAAWHRPRFEALLNAGVDYLIFTTIPSVKEAEALITLLKEWPGAKAIISFSAQDEEKISHGEKLSDAAQRVWELASDQLMAVGVNCLHPRLTLSLLRSVAKAAPHIPLFAKPNTIEIFNTETKEWEISDDGVRLPDYCRSYLQLGVKYISGCCRTSCQDIADFQREIKLYKP